MTDQIEAGHIGLPSVWSSAGRALARDLQGVGHEVVFAHAKRAGLAEFTAEMMRDTADLNSLRKLLARGDEFLDGLLAEEQVGYVLDASAIRRGMYQPWKR